MNPFSSTKTPEHCTSRMFIGTSIGQRSAYMKQHLILYDLLQKKKRQTEWNEMKQPSSEQSQYRDWSSGFKIASRCAKYAVSAVGERYTSPLQIASIEIPSPHPRLTPYSQTMVSTIQKQLRLRLRFP